MNRDEIIKGVCLDLGKVLDIDPEPIEVGHRIIDDLGGDSLDLLDLIFHLEQRFGIKFKPGEIERRARQYLGDVPLEVDGVYTPEALVLLRKAMPEVPETELPEGIGPSNLPKVFRVETFVKLVEILISEQKK